MTRAAERVNRHFKLLRQAGQPAVVYKLCKVAYDGYNRRTLISGVIRDIRLRVTYEIGKRITGVHGTPLFCYHRMDHATFGAHNINENTKFGIAILECYAECPVAVAFDFCFYPEEGVGDINRQTILSVLRKQVSAGHDVEPDGLFLLILAKALTPVRVVEELGRP